MDDRYVLEISFLRVHAYVVLLKTQHQIHERSLFTFSSSNFKVILKFLTSNVL